MNIFEGFRHVGFWGNDLLKGSPIKKNIQEIGHLLNNPASLMKINNFRIKDLLKHACTTTAFYKDFLDEEDLNAFPIVDKNVIRKNYNDFLSNEYKKESLIKVTTSGSYGTPFTFYLSKEGKKRQFSEVVFFNRWAGYKIGMKHVLIGAKERSTLTLLLQNQIFMKPSILDTDWLEEQREVLLKQKIKIIIGYPSVIRALAEYCKSKGDNSKKFSIKSIIATSEPLYNDTREFAEEVFGCDVMGRYASEELGVIAHECVQEKKYHLNQTSKIIEVIAMDEDRPALSGELGKVIVTDLFSHAMPLIRYDTGDLAILKEKCECGLNSPIFEKIEGRNVETVYNTKGTRVSPFSINNIMRDVEDVLQFQFIQKNADFYLLKLRALNSYSIDKNEEIIRKRLKQILGTEARIKIKYVSTIPPLKSGKRPYIISEYVKD